MEKNFDANNIEKTWQERWEKSSIFVAGKKENLHKKPYTIIMPPPNVTGTLHNGHALFVTLQDILARFYRMKGRDVLWLPGTDHAGIATQSVVERELVKKEGKSRHDLGRENFLKKVFEWKDIHGNKIIEQLKLMGASSDWSRLSFTMDEKCSKAVRKAFVLLWDEGLIFRKERLVSFDAKSGTALSNEEVEHEEREGELCFFKYALKEDKTKFISVATTRLETMLGDTAVAVNPKDDRYKNYIGKELAHPFIKDRKIFVISDDYVDMEYGTGAVKITPAHDPNDFLMGQRHKLPLINIFTKDLKINENGSVYKGLDRYEARKKLKIDLENLGLYEETKKIRHSVSISQRSGDVVEPMLSRQYFVNTKPLAQKAYEAVRDGQVRIIPDFYVKTYNHFMLNIEDWCISRQLWWGHRIPVYYHVPTMKKILGIDKSNEELLKIALSELSDEEVKKFSFAFIDEPENIHEYIQEEDVLDTWFSSGLWPFSTLGWPENTDDLKRYYPSDVLETGFDILFFWVARMMMLGIHFMKQPPFKDIYLHPMVRDAHGQKMSKSLGNAIDPIDVMRGISLNELEEKIKTYPVPKEHLPKVLQGIKKEYPNGIPKVGADGLRLSLAVFSGQGSDVRFNIPRVLGYGAFLNKIWNASRFALMNINKDDIREIKDIENKLDLKDRYILSKLNKTIKKVNYCIENYEFSSAAESIYDFFWKEFCDIYIEVSKVDLKDNISTKSVLIYLLDQSLRLIHPFCPFISEEIWQSLPINKKKEFLAISEFPKEIEKYIDDEVENSFDFINEIVSMIRNARQTSNIAVSVSLDVKILAENEETKKFLENYQDLISHLAKAKSIEFYVRGQKTFDFCAFNSSNKADVAISLLGLIDIEKELERLKNAIKKLDIEIDSLNQRLSNQDFLKNAKETVILSFKQNLNELLQKKSSLREQENRISHFTNR